MDNEYYMRCFAVPDQMAKKFTIILKTVLMEVAPAIILLAAGINLLHCHIKQDQIDVDELFLPFKFAYVLKKWIDFK